MGSAGAAWVFSGALWCGWGFGGCTLDFLVSASRGVGAGC